MNERYVDHDTGEIMRKETRLLRGNEFIKIINPSKSGRSIKFIKTRASQKAKRRMHNLTSHERGMLSIISLYAAPGTNVLIGDGERGKRGDPLNAADLCKIGGYSKSQGYRLIQSLLDKRALGFLALYSEEKVYVVNPDYYINGREVLPEIHKYFESEEDKKTDTPPTDEKSPNPMGE
ncbi:hypothetical protein [Brevibacillus laterosporus]|uniref:hypothetical protein n=1 Tax=Brevibacillus laterosporus TaxID=1465 RepID=UPI002E21BD25|nr:hypothetical protein [Brevibacillus laterosporus]MED1670409.1 hypothetical protein [Brevibacillus laterosporus]MED1720713.1 hypothetical protein [Brevibacillus laterosporus]